jgi:hypothetical protein
MAVHSCDIVVMSLGSCNRPPRLGHAAGRPAGMILALREYTGHGSRSSEVDRGGLYVRRLDVRPQSTLLVGLY